MILRDSYTQFPGHCGLCQSCVVPVVDTLRENDTAGGLGAMYICFNCASHMAQMVGFVAPERLADLEDELERTAQRLDEQETENADLAAQLESIKETIKLVTPGTPVKRSPGRPRKAE